MFMLDLFSWWYGNGWAGALRATGRRISGLAEAFSTQTLLHTLFAPWKRIVSYPGAGIDAKLHALLDNFVSRCVGFTVRFFVLIAAAIAFIGLCIFGLLEIVLWPLLPILAVALIVKGLL
jgi:hypothetical protein